MAAADGLGMLAVFGDPAAPELARTLDLAGYRWKALGSVVASTIAPAHPPCGSCSDTAEPAVIAFQL